MPLEVADFAEDVYPREMVGLVHLGAFVIYQIQWVAAVVELHTFVLNIMLCYTKGAVFLIYMGF